MWKALRRLRCKRAPYDWRTAKECEWLWDDLPPTHVKVVR